MVRKGFAATTEQVQSQSTPSSPPMTCAGASTLSLSIPITDSWGIADLFIQAGFLEPGEIIEALATQYNNKRILRVKFDRGWSVLGRVALSCLRLPPAASGCLRLPPSVCLRSHSNRSMLSHSGWVCRVSTNSGTNTLLLVKIFQADQSPVRPPPPCPCPYPCPGLSGSPASLQPARPPRTYAGAPPAWIRSLQPSDEHGHDSPGGRTGCRTQPEQRGDKPNGGRAGRPRQA